MLRPSSDAREWIALSSDPLPTSDAIDWATTPAAGAVVTFAGVVRDHAEGRDGVRAMTYEAYEEPAARAMGEIARELRGRWPEVERVALLHRVGDLELSETSVLVVVSSPHRRAAFDAALFAIDTLKESVPIWKQEHWSGGSDWAWSSIPSARSHRPRSDVAFLLFAVIVSAVGISIVLVRNRRPTSMEHSIAEFERGRRALAPDEQALPARRRHRTE